MRGPNRARRRRSAIEPALPDAVARDYPRRFRMPRLRARWLDPDSCCSGRVMTLGVEASLTLQRGTRREGAVDQVIKRDHCLATDSRPPNLVQSTEAASASSQSVSFADDGVSEPLQFVLNHGARIMLIPTGGFECITGGQTSLRPAPANVSFRSTLATMQVSTRCSERARRGGATIITEPAADVGIRRRVPAIPTVTRWMMNIFLDGALPADHAGDDRGRSPR